MDFLRSQTKINLMKAFAGENQARNRYTFAASKAKEQKLHVIQAVFEFTADQEKEHAEIFYNKLKQVSGENIHIDGAYPTDISDDVVKLLRFAHHNEYEEHDDVYKTFSEIAYSEGFDDIGLAFKNIAAIEKVHGDRFKMYADLLEQNKLFLSDVECKWMCLNCGHVLNAKGAPEVCPVCDHPKGYFIRLEFAPYGVFGCS